MALITPREFYEFMLSEESDEAQKEYHELPRMDLEDDVTRRFVAALYGTLRSEGLDVASGRELVILAEIMTAGSYLGAALAEKKIMREEVSL